MEIKYTDNQVPYIDLGNGYEIRLEYEDVENEDYLERGRNELRETPQLREKSLFEFRELLMSKHNYYFLNFIRNSIF
jgi:hypothetical protein